AQDRENDPIAEPVVRASRLLLLREEPGPECEPFRPRGLPQGLLEERPALGRVADADPLSHLPPDAARREVLARPLSRGAHQLVAEEGHRLAVEPDDALPFADLRA